MPIRGPIPICGSDTITPFRRGRIYLQPQRGTPSTNQATKLIESGPVQRERHFL